MPNTVRSCRPPWAARAALQATLAAACVVAACLAANGPAAAESDAEAAAREEVQRLDLDMGMAYRDVERDHGRVRAADWSEAVLGEGFAAVLTELVRGARARTSPRAETEDSAAAAALVRSLAARPEELPLTRTSLPVVLAETARAARADRAAVPRALFTEAARHVFAEAKVEDVWDARFLGLPVVEAFRAAKSKLLAAQEANPPAPPPGPVAGQAPSAGATDKGTEKPTEKPVEKTPGPLDDLVFFDKARPWVGPWTGWTQDVSEKLNKRQQRPVKGVWFDRFETTCAQYKAYLDGLSPAARRASLPQGWTLDDKDAVQAPAGKERHPVSGVSWRQAQAYADSQGKRLPTCDEWERAAAGGEKEPRTFPWGVSDEAKKWVHLGVEPKGTFPVDAFPDDATPEGLIGMAGNVTEIVSTYPDRVEVPKTGPEKGKQVLVCGGNFSSRTSECATSYRWVLDADGVLPTVGFRCVMDDAEYKKRKK